MFRDINFLRIYFKEKMYVKHSLIQWLSYHLYSKNTIIGLFSIFVFSIGNINTQIYKKKHP